MSDEFIDVKKNNIDELKRKLNQEMLKDAEMREYMKDSLNQDPSVDSFELSEELTQKQSSPSSEKDAAASFESSADISLLAKYEKLKKEFEELDESYKRLWADQQNMLKRFQKDKDDLRKYGAQSTIEAILPAIDNFDFAKKSIKMETAFEEILKSFDMLKMQFQMSLQAIGIAEVKTDLLFDPTLHEAVTSVPSEEHPEGTILEVIKTGYQLQGKVIRPALVVVVANAE
ncbi:MAG: nucleotide exchange factor GrpE [Cyanobacteria bacterium REEB446]|nr:nucleotide exchange factor GrpE [Cyanobacteria bacterium REEB446]